MVKGALARRNRPLAFAAIALTLATAACGGPIRRDELRRGVKSLGSTAAEGRLLAGEAAAGRLRDVFVRAHARELGDTATHEAEKLNDAAATGSTAAAKRQATQLAADISDALSQLQVAPQDHAVARHTADKLRHAAAQAQELEGHL